jgi:hypothetical protein
MQFLIEQGIINLSQVLEVIRCHEFELEYRRNYLAKLHVSNL